MSRHSDRTRERSRQPLVGIDKMAEVRGRYFVEDSELEEEADKAAKIYVRGNHFGKGPKNYERSDERIREDVCQALYDSQQVDATNIDVEVKNHTVYLRGLVEDRSTKRMAESAVENVAGVFEVQNELTFLKETPSTHKKLTDAERDLVNKMS